MTFTLYIKEFCPYSQKAMALLSSMNVKYFKHDVLQLGDTAGVIESLKRAKRIARRSTHCTVPIVFHNGKFIGGCEELAKYLIK